MTVLEMIRIVGPEFRNVSDADVSNMILAFKPMVSQKRFRQLFTIAMAYFVCHKMKMAGLGETPLGDLGAIGVGFSVSSVSEGGSSISFGANQSSNLTPDAELGLTAYGLQYLHIRRSAIIPIHTSGEPIEEATETVYTGMKQYAELTVDTRAEALAKSADPYTVGSEMLCLEDYSFWIVQADSSGELSWVEMHVDPDVDLQDFAP